MRYKVIKITLIVAFFTVILPFSSLSSEVTRSLLVPSETTRSLLLPEYSKVISMDFKDASIKDVLKIFSQQSGLNFIASEELEDRIVTMYLDDVPVEEALEQLLAVNRLTYEIQKGTNIFIVRPVLTPVVETITKVYFLKHASVSGAKITSEISSGLKCGGGEAGGGEASGGEAGGGEAGGTGLVAIISGLLSEYGKIFEDTRTNSLTITDMPIRFPLIERTIASLDIAVPQVLIEVEMLDVSKNTMDELGIQWPQTLVSLDMIGSRVTRFPFLGEKGNNTLYTFTDIETPSGNWEFSSLSGNSFAPSVLTVLGAELALDFIRTKSDTKYLARPRILTLSNETAEIKIATDEAIGVSTSTSGGESGASTTTAEAERVETGVLLRVTPQVNPDTDEMTIYIDPKVVEATVGGTYDGTTYKDPETRGTKSVVRVHDGETIVIGGLLRTRQQETTIKVPLLGDLPFIGAAFRHKSKTKDDERELVVFITPRIIKDVTSKQKLAAVKRIKREQGIPLSRVDAINDALVNIERKRW